MAVTVSNLLEMKAQAKKIAMVTAYDYPSALLADRAGVELILVGDSLGNTVLGQPTTVAVTMADILHHTRAVTRGVSRALVVADLPFMSYHVSVEETLRNAAQLLQTGGATVVKLEGAGHLLETIHRLVSAGVPVMGHLGLTPQSVNVLGGFRLQATTTAAASQLLTDALAIQEAGAMGLVLELVPSAVATAVTRRLTIPTIGIGAGPGCDGQVQVWHDLLGLTDAKAGRHARAYAQLGPIIDAALQSYIADVRSGQFPDEEHSFQGPTQRRAELAAWAETVAPPATDE